MDRLERGRRLHRRAIDRYIAEIMLELKREEINATAIKTKMDRLQESHDKILNLDRRVLDGMLDADATDDEMDQEMRGSEEVKNSISAIKILVNEVEAVKSTSRPDPSIAKTVTDMSVLDSSVEQLWKLDAIGITDPEDHQSTAEKEAAVQEHFLETMYGTPDGRNGVKLPWTDGAQAIPTNPDVAAKRLQSKTKRLVATGHFSTCMFKSWVGEGIIEVVDDESTNTLVHNLLHRAVIKPESTTTPERPVLDASCKTGHAPSVNDCLEKRPNLLELIPWIFTRFRAGKYGVISDIRKAFLMVEVAECDHDFLRFSWWENFDQRKRKVFRHRRVVLSVNSSSYLLAAVIEFHLKNLPPEEPSIAQKILESLYVDNCMTSVNSREGDDEFKDQATRIMADAKMELRLWQSNAVEISGIGSSSSDGCRLEVGSASASVLGLTWDLEQDILGADFLWDSEDLKAITKRKILSCAQRVFDPIGFISPALLVQKLILQEVWAQKLEWDEELPVEIQEKFLDWCKDLECLKQLKIPRNVTGIVSDHSNWQLHTFTDGNKIAYAAVVFQDGEASVQLVQSKSRVASTKKVSIPRLELLACTIGSRLAASVKSDLGIENISSFYWSDSTTALAWIRRYDEWGTFVGNRVKGICKLSNPGDWHHVPGQINPAELPSRGCTPKELLKSKWWEGPDWLKGPRSGWLSGIPDPNEDEVLAERKKTKTTTLLSQTTGSASNLGKFSSYHQNVRVIAWMKRAYRKPKKETELTVDELNAAELTLLQMVQTEVFSMDSDVASGIHVMKVGLLVQKGKSQPQQIKVGDVVLVGADGKKRWEWPIAKVVELYPGKDGHIRVAKVRTATGNLDRPLQRLYQLEVSSSSYLEPTADAGKSSDADTEEELQPGVVAEAPKDVRTRFGRSVKTPRRLGFT